jgi:hypothetical protein
MGMPVMLSVRQRDRVRMGMPVMLGELLVLGWTVQGSPDRSESIKRKQLCPGHEAAEEIAEEIAGVIAGFETLDSGEPTQRGVVSHGDSGRLGATSFKPISVDGDAHWATCGARFSKPAQSLNGKSAGNGATRSWPSPNTRATQGKGASPNL